MAVEAFVATLTTSQKLLAMELIWRDLSVSTDNLPTPDWNDDIVHERLDHPMPGETLNLREAFQEIQGWRNASKTSP